MNVRKKLVEEIVELELFNTKVETEDGMVPMYVAEGFNKEMIEAEGSTYIVYIYDTMNKYYQKHRCRIEKQVDEILKNALNHPTCKFCGSEKIEFNQFVGNAYCQECGEWQNFV